MVSDLHLEGRAEDCTTEMPYSFQARAWNQEQSEKLDELIEGKRTSDE